LPVLVFLDLFSKQQTTGSFNVPLTDNEVNFNQAESLKTKPEIGLVNITTQESTESVDSTAGSIEITNKDSSGLINNAAKDIESRAQESAEPLTSATKNVEITNKDSSELVNGIAKDIESTALESAEPLTSATKHGEITNKDSLDLVDSVAEDIEPKVKEEPVELVNNTNANIDTPLKTLSISDDEILNGVEISVDDFEQDIDTLFFNLCAVIYSVCDLDLYEREFLANDLNTVTEYNDIVNTIKAFVIETAMADFLCDTEVYNIVHEVSADSLELLDLCITRAEDITSENELLLQYLTKQPLIEETLQNTFDAYLDSDLGEISLYRLLKADNEIELPTHEHLRLLVTSTDVIHS
jgi:hypothetical protein